MRAISLLLTLFLLSNVSSAQKKNPLINTWIPIDIKDYTGESDSWGRSLMLSILTFQANDTLILTYGGMDHKRKFFYSLHSDTLELAESGAESGYFKVLERSEGRLRIFYDSFNIVTYQPFEAGNINIDHKKLKEHLTSNIWTFKQIKTDSKLEFPIDFRNGLQDSSFIHPDIYQYANDAYFKSTIHFNYHTPIWNIKDFNKTTILRIESIGFGTDDISGLFFIDYYKGNKLKAYAWLNGERVFFVGKAQKKNKSIIPENSDKLFASKWRFESAKSPKLRRIRKRDLIDLGTVEDDFWEYTGPDYIHDSTLLISVDDLDKKRLIFDFKKNGQFGIYREDQILDTGSWQGFFNNTTLKVNSDTQSKSDGIIRGYIEILHLTKNKLVLRREFRTSLNGRQNTEYSIIETYRPVR